MKTKFLPFSIILVAAIALPFLLAFLLGTSSKQFGDASSLFAFLYIPFGYLVARITKNKIVGLKLSFILGICVGGIMLTVNEFAVSGGISILRTGGISMLIGVAMNILPIVFATTIGGMVASFLHQQYKTEYVSMSQNSQSIPKENPKEMLQFLSRFILFVSVLYIIFGGFIIVPSLIMVPIWPVFIIAIIFSRFLPITQFGNPFEIGLSGVGVNENMFPLFGIIALMSGITALWSGVLIGKLRILGMCIYTGVVLLLVAGTLLDSIILQSESHHYQSGPAFGLSYIMFVVFLLSVLFGWRQF